jgi:hypothetical protein
MICVIPTTRSIDAHRRASRKYARTCYAGKPGRILSAADYQRRFDRAVACFQRKVASLWKREAHGQLRTSTIYQIILAHDHRAGGQGIVDLITLKILARKC